MTTPLCHDGLRLVATRSAISCAGLFVVSTLTRWGTRSILLDAVLVTEELVTSAVKATGVMDEHVHWTEVTRINFITVHRPLQTSLPTPDKSAKSVAVRR